MMSLRGKVAIAFITCAAFVLASVPGLAAPAACQDASSEVAAPQGVKSKAVVRAVLLVAMGIRKGTAHFGTIVMKIDKASVGAFLKHSGKIANLLEDIARIPDLTLGIVGQRLFQMLSDKEGAFKIKPDLAKDITEEIMGVINALL